MPARSPCIEVILVDFDGVLRRWPADDTAIERAHGLPDGSLRAAAFDPRLLQPLVQGRLRDEEWRAAVAQRLCRQFPAAHVSSAVAHWSAGIGTIDRDLLALLQGCTARLVLVSNGSTRLRADLDRHGIAACFDAIVNSAEIGVAKPSAAYFATALAQAGATAPQALLIDDSATYIGGASACGIRTHHYDGIAGVRSLLREAGLYTDD